MILTFSAVISYQHFVNQYQLIQLVNTLLGGLQYARFEAMNLGNPVDYCPKDNSSEKCGDDWQNGQLVIEHSTHRLLREYPPVSKIYRLRWFGSLGINSVIQWEPDGMTYGQQGSFWIGSVKSETSPMVQVIVLRSGRIKVNMSNN